MGRLRVPKLRVRIMGFFAFWLRVKLWSLRPVTVTFKKNLTFFLLVMGNYGQFCSNNSGRLRAVTGDYGLQGIMGSFFDFPT